MKTTSVLAVMSCAAAQDVFLDKAVALADELASRDECGSDGNHADCCNDALTRLAYTTALLVHYVEGNQYKLDGFSDDSFTGDVWGKVEDDWKKHGPQDNRYWPDATSEETTMTSEETTMTSRRLAEDEPPPLCNDKPADQKGDCTQEDGHGCDKNLIPGVSKCGCPHEECPGFDYACVNPDGGSGILTCLNEGDDLVHKCGPQATGPHAGDLDGHQLCRLTEPCDASDSAKICHDNGKASGTKGSCTCKCKKGWSGEFCDIQACDDHADCHDNGEASGTKGNCHCKCKLGFKGPTCDIHMRPATQLAPAFPDGLPADVQQIYYLTRQWLDDGVNQFYPASEGGSPRVLKDGWRAAEYEPIVNTPWFNMLFSFLDDHQNGLISGFRKFDGEKPLTLWAGDPAPKPEANKVAEATLFGLLLKKFMPGESGMDLGSNCHHDLFQTSVWEAASQMYVKTNPQQNLQIVLKQQGFNTIEPDSDSESCKITGDMPQKRCPGAMLWTTEIPNWINHTEDYCEGMLQGVPEKDQNEFLYKQKNVGGQITIYVETTEDCEARFNDPVEKVAHDKNIPHPCKPIAPAGTPFDENLHGLAEGLCTKADLQHGHCGCPAAKLIRNKFMTELNDNPDSSCQNMVEVKCKDLRDFPGERCDAIQDGAGQRMIPTKHACGDKPSCAPGGGSHCMWCVYDESKCENIFDKAACDRTKDLMKKMNISQADCRKGIPKPTEAVVQGWQPSLVLGLVFAGGAAGAGAGAVATYLASRSSGHA